jgi:hypothetical protein
MTGWFGAKTAFEASIAIVNEPAKRSIESACSQQSAVALRSAVRG